MDKASAYGAGDCRFEPAGVIVGKSALNEKFEATRSHES